MRVVYLKDNKRRTITASNEDVTIFENRDGHRTTVKLVSNAEITLVKADVSYPCHINYQDLYFLKHIFLYIFLLRLLIES